jgi:hypothetical protein
MPGVGAAVAAGDDVIFTCHDVDEASLTLVTSL